MEFGLAAACRYHHRRPGVRPSSGAARSTRPRTLESSETPLLPGVAAPEDGRTPVARPRRAASASLPLALSHGPMNGFSAWKRAEMPEGPIWHYERDREEQAISKPGASQELW